MESGVTTEELRIGGMLCVNCQNKVEKSFVRIMVVRIARKDC